MRKRRPLAPRAGGPAGPPEAYLAQISLCLGGFHRELIPAVQHRGRGPFSFCLTGVGQAPAPLALRVRPHDFSEAGEFVVNSQLDVGCQCTVEATHVILCRYGGYLLTHESADWLYALVS